MRVPSLPVLMVTFTVCASATLAAAEAGLPQGNLFRAPQKKSFANLFAGQRTTDRKPPPMPSAVVQRTVRRSAPTVVCGMTLIPVDPTIDAAMRHLVPDTGAKPTIRSIPAPACRD